MNIDQFQWPLGSIFFCCIGIPWVVLRLNVVLQCLPGNLLTSPPPLGLPKTHGRDVSPDTLSYSVLPFQTPLILPSYISWDTAFPKILFFTVCTLILLEMGSPLPTWSAFLGRACFPTSLPYDIFFNSHVLDLSLPVVPWGISWSTYPLDPPHC